MVTERSRFLRAWMILVGLLLTTQGLFALRQLDLEGLRAKWSRKSEAERELLKERFEELRSMDPDLRAQLRERARGIRAAQKELLADAPDGLRQELNALEADERERRERRYLRERKREWGRHVRKVLPDRFVQELREAPPRERLRMFDRFRQEQRRRKSLKAIMALAEEMDLGPEEVRRLREVPVEERMGSLRRLRRRHLEREARGGRLPGITPAEWSRLESLSDEAFFGRMRGRKLPPLKPGGPRRGERRGPPPRE